MANAVKLKIAFEISQIDELIEKSSVLLQKCILQEPDFIELNAAGAILHSYYMGFRHFFRHTYGYHLRWDLIKPLLMNIKENWNTVKSNIETIIIEA